MTRRQRLARRLRPGQAGLTLVELLLAVAITVVIAGFVLQGITMTRQAFQRDAVAERRVRADAAILAVAGLIEATLPVKARPRGANRPTVAFDGGGTALRFIALGNGFAMQGGLSAVTIRRDRDGLVADVTPVREGQALAAAEDANTRTVRLLAPVTGLRFRYFGRRTPDGAADWQAEWRDAESLPDLLSIAVEGAAAGQDRQPLVVALRQR